MTTRGRSVPESIRNQNGKGMNAGNDERRPTSVREAKRLAREGQLYTLPGSGIDAKLRKPALRAMMIGAGFIPNKLSAEVQEFILRRRDDEDRDDPIRQREVFEKNMIAHYHILELAFIDPGFSLAGDERDDVLGPGDITDVDVLWLVNVFVEGEDSDVEQFRVDSPVYIGRLRDVGLYVPEVRTETLQLARGSGEANGGTEVQV